jgi:hypothetical protein
LRGVRLEADDDMNGHVGISGARRAFGWLGAAALLAACANSPSPDNGRSPAVGLTREQAVALARATARSHAGRPVQRTEMGPFRTIAGAYAGSPGAPSPMPDQWVWLVHFGETTKPVAGIGNIVILDFFDGRVIQEFDYNWIA